MSIPRWGFYGSRRRSLWQAEKFRPLQDAWSINNLRTTVCKLRLSLPRAPDSFSGVYQVLISKDWCSFGHRFATRSGYRVDPSGETAPIFLQFLDATQQLLRQFPEAFEFSEDLLLLLVHAYHSRWVLLWIMTCSLVVVVVVGWPIKFFNSALTNSKPYPVWGHLNILTCWCYSIGRHFPR